MGACLSAAGGASTEEHREAEKVLREAKRKMETEVKVLLLGSGDSGKTTILKQMRIIHDIPFTPQEVESYRQIVFGNITHGFHSILEAMEAFDLKVAESNQDYVALLDNPIDIREGQEFPEEYKIALQALWADPSVRKAWERGNEVALPENIAYFLADIDRLFTPAYVPSNQDILRCRARTTGIIETVFHIRAHELHMLDVGGQKSERRKWIHCFQDVTAILFLVSLSGYDQCLVEDKDANQMLDALAIWDSICHSQWFRNTSLILFLNKVDLFTDKVAHSPIKTLFPDYEGKEGDVEAGREYFKKRFLRLSVKSSRMKDREIYIHYTTATDTQLLSIVMSAVEDVLLRGNLSKAALL